MRNLLLFAFIFLVPVSAQVDLRGGMGINFVNIPGLTDYINQNNLEGSDIGDFNSAISFSGEVNYYFSPSFALGVEIAYTMTTYNFNTELTTSEFNYNSIIPSLTAYYVTSGPGYNFKFGGGIGPRFSNLEEDYGRYVFKYNSTGYGILLKADGNTGLSQSVYANIGIDMRYDLNGNFRPQVRSEDISLNAFTFGIRLGLTFEFF